MWAVVDTALILTAYTAAFWARALAATLDYYNSLDFILITVAITLVMLYVFGVYHRIWSQTSGHGITIIIKAIASTTILIILVDLVIKPRPLPLSVVIMATYWPWAGL